MLQGLQPPAGGDKELTTGHRSPSRRTGSAAAWRRVTLWWRLSLIGCWDWAGMRKSAGIIRVPVEENTTSHFSSRHRRVKLSQRNQWDDLVWAHWARPRLWCFVFRYRSSVFWFFFFLRIIKKKIHQRHEYDIIKHFFLLCFGIILQLREQPTSGVSHFHRGPHQHNGCPQRARCNL